MADLTDTLIKRLDEWVKVAGDDTKVSDQAIGLLEAAEKYFRADRAGEIDRAYWHKFLDLTGRSEFLTILTDRDYRYRWSGLVEKVIALTDYSLHDMLTARVREYRRKTLFQDMAETPPRYWSYEVSYRNIRTIAAYFLKIRKEPRVAIYADNSVTGAWCDLACLCFDILVSPLNTHFDVDSLADIFDRLDFNIAVTDSGENYERLQQVQKSVKTPFEILTLNPVRGIENNKELLETAYSSNSAKEIETLLAERRRFRMTEVCTVMFTSGSTGRPKGISFSQYNLVTKRFARAAALPEVGRDEVLICYLPLYHTFGRYFEMLGAIYWRGTYVFPGSNSAETLMNLLAELNPTGLISIPLRWTQIQEQCLARMESATTSEMKAAAVRNVIGGRLCWGLSAAGYLAPSVFRFFNNHGVNLCSGFGMTEATGGITMTPPGEYVDNSIGVPLPGVRTRLSEEGELAISGAYIARYLDDKGPGDDIPLPGDEHEDYRLPTGDIFRKIDNGHLEIVDRLKDIYKNNKGQTIAPQRIEKKFEGVPGIKRTFLVGDAREDNVLLMVPDQEDPILKGFDTDESQREYFHQIVSNANKDLAVYERVVNFALLDRDFAIDKDELTPKGSYRRKNIEHNFKALIDSLYKESHIELSVGRLQVRIPRWIYRDLSVLEDDIFVESGGLHNRANEKRLPVKWSGKKKRCLIGNLEYEISGQRIDLGVICRQPALWLGNPALIDFFPCKEGWDLPAAEISRRVYLPEDSTAFTGETETRDLLLVRDQTLSIINRQIIRALFGSKERSVGAIEQLGLSLAEADDRVARVIRRRLEALAYYPEFDVRSAAYRVLLLDEPTPNYGKVFPAFIDSGLPFLNEETINKIASVDLKKRRLEALRLRLFSYRTQLRWPAKEAMRQQFIQIFRLLTDFARYHPDYYDMVRCELASWILLKEDKKLARAAEEYLTALYQDYEKKLTEITPEYSDNIWESKIVFGDELNEQDKDRLRGVLFGTTFLKQSIILGFDESDFELEHVPQGGIWISRILSRRRNLRYRVSVNMVNGKHYDLQIIIRRDVARRSVLETIYWLMSLSSYPYGPRLLPRLGCARPELGARSLVYLGDLTVWEKIREYTGYQASNFTPESRHWRKLFIRALTAFFRGWRISGRRIVPGTVSPENIVVADQDFRESATIQSLTGWLKYEDTLSLVRPMVQNFYRKTISHYPSCLELIEFSWIFGACLEELGLEKGEKFLKQLKEDIELKPLPFDSCGFVRELDKYLNRIGREYIFPLPVQNAIDRYHEWSGVNSQATPAAREQIIGELIRLYRLDRFSQIAYYYLYRYTYFAETSESVRQAFDRLLGQMFRHPGQAAIQMIELSELQSTLDNEADREVFGHMIFPKAEPPRQVEVFAIGDSRHKHVVVKTTITDEYGEEYIIREPIEPAEIGRLYRLFFKEGYPKTVTDRDQFLLVIDAQEQLIGGLCFRKDGDDVIHLDGSVISGLMMGRGIGGALLEDFCTRMANQGMRIVKTHFFLRNFYAKHGFEVDTRWGALIRHLYPSEDTGQ